MDKVHLSIKNNIEGILLKAFNQKCQVEFVEDVAKRAEEINELFEEKLGTLSNDKALLRGTYILPHENHPSYILIYDDLEQQLFIKTAYHEFQHAVDLAYFSLAVFGDLPNDTQIRGNKLYITFNIYSEFSAQRFGVSSYLSNVDFINLSKEEVAFEKLKTYKTSYEEQLLNIKDKFQYTLQTISFLGQVEGLSAHNKAIDINVIIRDLIDADIFFQVLDMFNEEKKDKQWYEKFDKFIRAYIG